MPEFHTFTGQNVLFLRKFTEILGVKGHDYATYFQMAQKKKVGAGKREGRGEEGGREEKSKCEKKMTKGEVGKMAYGASQSCKFFMSLQLF